MKILLTGKTGQVGYELERSLQGLGEVVALDRSQLDLANLDQLRRVIRDIKPSLIVNAAAYTAVDAAESAPELAMLINGAAPALMAQEARRLGAAMIHYSTDYVFDGSKCGPYTEADVPCPINVYGRSKLAGEQAIVAAGIPHLILRTSWVYGMRGKNFLLTIERLAQERDELRIVADQIGAPTWCRTIAQTSARMIAQIHGRAPLSSGADAARLSAEDAWRDLSGIYHLTAQGTTSWHGFASAIVAHRCATRRPRIVPIASHEFPLPASRPLNGALSCERLIATFGALPTWQHALRLCQDG